VLYDLHGFTKDILYTRFAMATLMMEKSAKPGVGGGFTYKVEVYAPAEREDY
jgi:hypothetical protein